MWKNFAELEEKFAELDQNLTKLKQSLILFWAKLSKKKPGPTVQSHCTAYLYLGSLSVGVPVNVYALQCTSALRRPTVGPHCVAPLWAIIFLFLS